MIIHLPGKDKRELTLRFGIGTPVIFKACPEIRATVIGVSIRPGDVYYECSWISGDARQTDLVPDCELAPQLPERKAGFEPRRKGRRSRK